MYFPISCKVKIIPLVKFIFMVWCAAGSCLNFNTSVSNALIFEIFINFAIDDNDLYSNIFNNDFMLLNWELSIKCNSFRMFSQNDVAIISHIVHNWTINNKVPAGKLYIKAETQKSMSRIYCQRNKRKKPLHLFFRPTSARS